MNRIATVALLLLMGHVARSCFAGEALTWESSTGYRRAKLNVPASGKAGFTLLAGEITGIRWTNFISTQRYSERQNLMNGAGLALGDFDNNGWCDLYLCNKQGPNALYRNLGNWKFEDVAERAGVTCTNQSSNGATFADLNGDGRLDLLVTGFAGPNACYLNLGAGRFTNITAAAGLTSKGGSTTQALADIDGDGDLDLYVCYFGVEAILRDGAAYSHRMVNGKPVVTGRYAKRLTIINGQIIELGEPHILYLNDGKGQFTVVDWKLNFRDESDQPISSPPDFGLAVQMRDINGDGFPDIYVCNDFQTPDRLWLNDGRGHFRAAPRLSMRNMSYASMGADFADIDRDGNLDFFAVEMLSRDHARYLNQSSPMNPSPRVIGAIDIREDVTRNTLHWNRGDGTFAEIAFYAGVAASDWSWTPIFIDVDLDGFEDILVSTGHLHDVNDRDVAASRRSMGTQPRPDGQKLLLQHPRLDTPNAAFRNQGNLTFADTSTAWGFDSRNISHGMAMADLDNDGDLDVAVNCLNAAPLLYRNDSSAPRVAVRLKGDGPNTQGIGGKVTLSGGAVTQIQEIVCGGRYLSGDDPLRIFAGGSPTNELRIDVSWRNGKRSVVQGAKANWIYEISEAGSLPPMNSPKSKVQESKVPGVEASTNASSSRITHPSAIASATEDHASPIFQDVSSMLNHTHHDEPFDDFSRQPLLSRKLSQSGPGVAWFDFDNDGFDDLIISAGKGGRLAFYQNNSKGGFNRIQTLATHAPASQDLTGIIGWTSAEGRPALLLGLSNYEAGTTNLPSALRYDFAKGGFTEGPGLAGSPASTGPLSVADIDGDSDLDLFVGGRVLPGRYPEAAASRMYRNDAGQLTLDRENSQVLEKVGLVSGSVFSDLDGDGQADLILACEWGPIRVFGNSRGNFTEITSQAGLAGYVGLWNGVTTGDLDGDGRLDIIAGNWGSNSFYNRAPEGSWHLFYGDFNRDGNLHLLEAFNDVALQKIVPWRDMEMIAGALPWVRERFSSHKAFARASIAEILGDRTSSAKELQVTTLASMIFFNRGHKFEAVPLPMEAQWAPALGISVGDMDGDGNEDLFLSQNFFAVRTEDNRCDAGRGLWLKGDGKGALKSISGQESGVIVYGEQRGCALADYDHDGRVDLVVTQNGAATKLYHNVSAKPGLRVRLQGLAGNPTGVGTTMRLVFGQRMGPAREIHAGSGYWSQDSARAVLGTAESPTQIWVRWPGGKTITVDIPKDAKEIVVIQRTN